MPLICMPELRVYISIPSLEKKKSLQKQKAFSEAKQSDYRKWETEA